MRKCKASAGRLTENPWSPPTLAWLFALLVFAAILVWAGARIIAALPPLA
jgi:hypothetical protein